MSISIQILKNTLNKSSNATLQRTIANSQARIARFNASGLGNSGAEQTEINRVQAAVDILSARGFYATAPKSIAGLPANVTGQGGLIHQPWFKPAALLFVGFVVFRKLL